MSSENDHPGALGLWAPLESMRSSKLPAFAAEVEALGYTTLWIPETTGRDPFASAAFLLSATTHLRIATGIANIYHRHPGAMAQAAWTLAEQSGGRFLLGLGVSHSRMVEGVRGLSYGRPVASMRAYLAQMDEAPYNAVPPSDPPKRVLAALGPRMLELARDAADGAHPYWGHPEHTARAREILGPDKLLCVEQKVVLEKNPSDARVAARAQLAHYAELPNYRRHWQRIGFSDDDLAGECSDRVVDGLVAWGDESAIASRIREHRDAGADHVCIQPIPVGAPFGRIDLGAVRALASLGTA